MEMTVFHLMKTCQNWINWKPGQRKKKMTKIPVRNGKPFDVTQGTYLTYDEAILESSRIGFVFTKDDPFFGIDYDGIKGPYIPGTYGEISISQTGSHTIGIAEEPFPNTRWSGVEIYFQNLFFVVTEDLLWDDIPIAIDMEAWMKENGLWRPESSRPISNKNSSSMDDEELLSIIKNSRDKWEFLSLYEGFTTGFPSQSEADARLCKLIAKHTNDPIQIDRIFRKSKLFRPKWDRGRNITYGQRTIRYAINRTGKC